MSTITYGSLFSGVGGADLGLERAGMRCLWTCEFDRQAQDVLRFHNPEVTNHADVRTFPAWEVECPDVLWMSPPCQDLSVAGKRAGLAGGRSGLFYVAANIASNLRERGLKWILMEQVPGLFSSNGAEDVRSVLEEFSYLGLSVAWRVLDSQWFGVPQRRRRAFFVVDTRGERAGEVLALAQGLCGDSAPSRETREASPEGVAGCLGGGSGARGYPNSPDVAGAFIPTTARALMAKANDPHRPDMATYIPTVSGTLGANHGNIKAEHAWTSQLIPHTAHTLRADGFDASEDGTGRGTPLVPIAFPSFAQDCEIAAAGIDISPTLKTDDNPMAVAFQEAQTGCREYAEAGTLRANGPGHDPVGTRIRQGMAVRRLTPRECERLQGWSDDFTRYGRKPDGTVYEQADGPRYKQCGNGVTATVSAWIGRNLVAQEAALA